MLPSSQSSTLDFRHLGEVSFDEARQLQNELVDLRIQNLVPDTILFCEHPKTLTRGIRATDSELLSSHDNETQIVTTDRGGQWTAHEPGQLVIYPVINLKERKLSPKCAVKYFLDSIARVLINLDISAKSSQKPAGVFVEGKKIASIGLKISRGVTNHGISLNVHNSLELFQLIIPCGLVDMEMTSITKQLGREMDISKIFPLIEKEFRKDFLVVGTV
jgi:lipoyl(octanoyl) transferase